MFYQNTFLEYYTSKPYSEPTFEDCSICGHKEKAGYNYCRTKTFKRNIFCWVISTFAISLGIASFYIFKGFQIKSMSDVIPVIIYIFAFFIAIYFSIHSIRWKLKIEKLEKAIIKNVPKQKHIRPQ